MILPRGTVPETPTTFPDGPASPIVDRRLAKNSYCIRKVTKLKQKRLHSLLLPALALCIGSLPATAGVLFSDLGPPGNVYSPSAGRALYGSGVMGASYSEAALFTVAGTGSLDVGGIDLAVSYQSGYANTFDASIWTDSGALPGLELASWLDLSTTTANGSCCGLVSLTGIMGVTLTGGQEYFMVLGPVNPTDNSGNLWMWNTQGVAGVSSRYSNDGGATWSSYGPDEQQVAFDITTTPEPGSLLLFGTGLIGILVVRAASGIPFSFKFKRLDFSIMPVRGRAIRDL